MKNFTISMDDDLVEQIEHAAAAAGTSVSEYLAEAGRQKLESGSAAAALKNRNLQLAALERFLAGPKLAISENGRMPTAEERNARR
jgi:predicted transcriptional regulator